MSMELCGEEVLEPDDVSELLGQAESALQNGLSIQLHPVTLKFLCVSHERLRALVERYPQPA